LGFIFTDSPRRITVKDAKPIIKSLPPFISCVGLFANEYVERVREVCGLCGIHIVQLHGDEPPEYLSDLTDYKVVKAFRVRDKGVLDTLEKYTVDAFLLDSFAEDKMGGTGTAFPWEIAREAKRFGQIIIAGGLTPENIADAVTIAQPYAVDVSSGVEIHPGKKDKELIRKFIAVAKGDYKKREK
ncbi:MAG: phosphoribosylanthranilate isomerase, partial [Candidatus Brocadiales bacterium]